MTNSARMAKYTQTPADYYLGLTVGEFYNWIGVCNKMIEEDKRR